VVATFSGKDILLPSGELDRDALGKIIFQDVNARRKMNRATHIPVLFGILRQLLFSWVCMKRVVVLDMPLLFETGFYHVTKPNNILISCSKETQLSRLVSRDGLQEREASARIEAQMPIELKQKKADIIIDNDEASSIVSLKESVTRAVEEIRRKSWFQAIVTSPLGVGFAVLLACRMVLPGS